MALVDSGSTISVVHPTMVSDVPRDDQKVYEENPGQIRLADGSLLHTVGTATVTVGIKDRGNMFSHAMVVADIESPVVIGLDLLREHKCVLDLARNRLILGNHAQLGKVPARMPSLYRISVVETVDVPPMSEMIIPGKVDGQTHFTLGMVENGDCSLCDGNVAVGKVLINPTLNCIPIRVMNMSSESQTLYQDMNVALCEPVMNTCELGCSEDNQEVETGDENAETEDSVSRKVPQYLNVVFEGWDQRLTNNQQGVAKDLVLDSQDIYVKSRDELSTTHVDSHRMKMSGTGGVKQPLRRIPLSKRSDFKKELDRILELGVIEPSTSSWSSPLVLVTKKDGSLRTCVDFRLMNSLTIKDSYPLPRIDESLDALQCSRTVDEHVDWLREVFTRLREANLKLSPKKTHLFHQNVECLGFVVSKDGIATDPRKIDAITKWPTPRNVRQVRSFLGLCSYYRKFVKGFADIARPLHRLTEKGHQFEWTLDCDESFNLLKQALKSPPILGYPEGDGSFILDADASGEAIGAVLSQIQQGEERVIAYYSCVLEKRERQYCVTRRELLAIIKSVKHFPHYLYGRHFTIRTDHGSLRWLLRFKNRDGQMVWWLKTLYIYDFEVQHRAGSAHGNADALSRRPCHESNHCDRLERKEVRENDDCQHCTKHKLYNLSLSVGEESGRWIEPWTSEKLREMQDQDPVVHKALPWMKAGRKPPWNDVKAEGAQVRIYRSEFERLKLIDGVLYRTGTNPSTTRLVAPLRIRNQIFDFLHKHRIGGHLGIKRTTASARQRFWWPSMKKDVTRWCAHCNRCQMRELREGAKRSHLHQDPVGSPMEKIAFDILSFPTATDQGNTCVIVISDYFTKWTEAFPLKNHQAATVADTLVTQVFLRFGIPRIIHSDQAAKFMSDLIHELCYLLDIKQTRTCPYSPQSDGLVERFNRTLTDMLAKFCGEKMDDWDRHLPYLMSAYRATMKESTSCSPNLLMLGREITLPIDLMHPPTDYHPYQCQVEYVELIRRTMQDNYELARKNLRTAAERQKKYCDERTKGREFQEGDWVLRFYPPKLRNKLNSPYIGPYKVLRKLGEVTYLLQLKPSYHPVAIHVDHLKLFRTEDTPVAWRTTNENDNGMGPDDAVMDTSVREENISHPGWTLWRPMRRRNRVKQ